MHCSPTFRPTTRKTRDSRARPLASRETIVVWPVKRMPVTTALMMLSSGNEAANEIATLMSI